MSTPIVKGETLVESVFDRRYGILYRIKTTGIDPRNIDGSLVRADDGEIDLTEVKAVNTKLSHEINTHLEELPAPQIYYGLRRESSFPPVLSALTIVGTETYEAQPTFIYPPDVPLEARYTRSFSFGPPERVLGRVPFLAQPYNKIIQYVETAEVTSSSIHGGDGTDEGTRGSSGTNARTELQSSAHTSVTSGAHNATQAVTHNSAQTAAHTGSSSNTRVSVQSTAHSTVNVTAQSSAHGSAELSAHISDNSSANTSVHSSTHGSSHSSIDVGGHGSTQAQAHSGVDSSAHSTAHADQGEGHTMFRVPDGDRVSTSSNHGTPLTTDPHTETVSDESGTHHATTDNWGTSSQQNSASSFSTSNTTSQSKTLSQSLAISSMLRSIRTLEISKSQGQSLASSTVLGLSYGTNSSTGTGKGITSSSESSIGQLLGREVSSSNGIGQSVSNSTETSSSTGQSKSNSSSTGTSESTDNFTSTSTSSGTSTQDTTSVRKSLFHLSLPPCLHAEITVTSPVAFVIPATTPVDLPWSTDEVESWVAVASNSEHWEAGVWVTELVEVLLPIKPIV